MSFRSVMLMKPGPAIDFSVSGSARSSSLRFWRIAAATSRGFWLSRLARGIAALIWKSPKVGFLDGATCGSWSAACGYAAAIAADARWAMREVGSRGLFSVLLLVVFIGSDVRGVWLGCGGGCRLLRVLRV